MSRNECDGCIYDLIDDDVNAEERFDIILSNCCVCKRAMKEEYRDKYLDLYKVKEDVQ